MNRLQTSIDVALDRLEACLQRVPFGWFLIGATLGVCVIAFSLFSPRLVVWQGLFPRAGLWHAETGRAFETLRQLENPGVRITSDVNGVLNWRLLFPVVGYALQLPPVVFLSLPFCGCGLAAAAIITQLTRSTGSRLMAITGGLLLCTTSWFQVSTGWLAYFDSWYVLGLLGVAFAPGAFLPVVACVLTPWVDERFVIAFPLALLIRQLTGQATHFFVLWASLLPFFAIRLLAAGIIATDGSVDYLSRHLVAGQNLPKDVLHLITGIWNGLRFAWPYAGWFGVMVLRQPRLTKRLVGGGVLIATFLVCAVIAGDLSRSMAALIPAAVAGLGLTTGLTTACSHRLARIGLVTATLLNCLTPAWHVTADFTTAIASLPHEYANLSQPPVFLTAAWNNRRGLQLQAANRLDEAYQAFDTALRLDPQFAAALVNRGLVLAAMGYWADAGRDLERALPLLPDDTPMRRKTAAFLQEISGRAAGGTPVE